MGEKTAVRTREKWVDDVKVIACILVVLGHFFQSMTKANILPENDLYEWFETTIYYFHVPLFFICSGYLYQKYSKVNSVSSWCKNGLKKALALGVPYLTFSTATWLLKTVFADSVNLYTIDLICHGSPSPRILNMALEEKGIDIKKLTQIRFRNKTNFGLSSQDAGQVYKTLTPAGIQDMYTYAFLTSLDYTENCYSCQYATIERVADVTIGDSWGSDLPQKEQGRGVSLLLCQTDKGANLVKNSGMQLKEVDIDKAIDANHQLRHPSVAPDIREAFFAGLDKGFYKSLSNCAPKVYYKQKVKEILIKTKIIRGGQKQ